MTARSILQELVDAWDSDPTIVDARLSGWFRLLKSTNSPVSIHDAFDAAREYLKQPGYLDLFQSPPTDKMRSVAFNYAEGMGVSTEALLSAYEAIRAVEQPEPAVPPREPTPEMIKAGQARHEPQQIGSERLAMLWRAMYDAANQAGERKP